MARRFFLASTSLECLAASYYPAWWPIPRPGYSLNLYIIFLTKLFLWERGSQCMGQVAHFYFSSAINRMIVSLYPYSLSCREGVFSETHIQEGE